MFEDFQDIPATELLKGFSTGAFSPLELVRACIARIESLNPALNAFCHVESEQALKAAADSENRWHHGEPAGPLDGLPVSVKDLLYVRGWPTHFGSKAIDPTRKLDMDSPCVARLREAGAIFLGKTTTPEFGHKGVTDSPLHGITRNPWHTGLTPGGSSGGAAVAAATGMGVLHLGSDGGGSLRIPGSFTGVFGIKPSNNIVPAWPPSPFATLATPGPMTRFVSDAALAMDYLTLPDRRDWHALPYRAGNYLAALDKPLPKLRIAVARRINDTVVNDDVDAVFGAALAHIGALGEIEEIELELPGVVEVFNTFWMAGVRSMMDVFTDEQKEMLDAKLLDWQDRAKDLTLERYKQAELQRAILGEMMNDIMYDYDLLVTPTTAMTAFPVGQNKPLGRDGKPWEDWNPFTYPANLTKVPAASVPCGFTEDGLPVGMQIASAFGNDALVLQAAHAFERRARVKRWTPADLKSEAAES